MTIDDMQNTGTKLELKFTSHSMKAMRLNYSTDKFNTIPFQYNYCDNHSTGYFLKGSAIKKRKVYF